MRVITLRHLPNFLFSRLGINNLVLPLYAIFNLFPKVLFNILMLRHQCRESRFTRVDLGFLCTITLGQFEELFNLIFTLFALRASLVVQLGSVRCGLRVGRGLKRQYTVKRTPVMTTHERLLMRSAYSLDLLLQLPQHSISRAQLGPKVFAWCRTCSATRIALLLAVLLLGIRIATIGGAIGGLLLAIPTVTALLAVAGRLGVILWLLRVGVAAACLRDYAVGGGV